MTRSSYRRQRDPSKLPYQVFIQCDGSEILCDRLCRPTWKRQPGQPAQRLTPPADTRREYIPHVRHEYMHDGGPVSAELRRRLLRIEADFIAGKPIEKPLERKHAIVKGRPHLRLINGGRDSQWT
jgi:hypothetical protein